MGASPNFSATHVGPPNWECTHAGASPYGRDTFRCAATILFTRVHWCFVIISVRCKEIRFTCRFGAAPPQEQKQHVRSDASICQETTVAWLVIQSLREHHANHNTTICYLHAKHNTCRYTPLLAYLLIPNVTLHIVWGKLLFAAADIVAAVLLHRLVAAKVAARPYPEPSCGLPTAAAALWLCNPYTATISTRGNGDSLVVVMQLLTLHLLRPVHNASTFQGLTQRVARLVFSPAQCGYRLTQDLPLGRAAAAGAVFGLLVHWRVFPVLYGPCLVAHLHRAAGGRPGRWLAACVVFGAAALAVFGGLGALFYNIYGSQFAHEAFLYHAARHDPRHSFSPHFLLTYLTRFSTPPPPAVPPWLDAGAAALPALAAVVCAAAWRLQLEAAFLVTTMAFVAFNKVSTAQYFVWFFGLLPAVLPELLHGSAGMQVVAAAGWVATQLLWLGGGYLLEFKVRLRYLTCVLSQPRSCKWFSCLLSICLGNSRRGARAVAFQPFVASFRQPRC